MNLMPLSSRVICIFLAFSLSSTLALGQAGPRPEKKKNRCTVCLHHPKLMEDFAFHHGKFPFLTADNEALTNHIDNQQILWIETKHFRIGCDLKKWKIPLADKENYFNELSALAEKFPAINPKKTKTLDRWLRFHLFAERMEAFYQRFLQAMGFEDQDFGALPGESLFEQCIQGPDFFEPLKEQFLKEGPWPERFPQEVGLGKYLGSPFRFEVLMLQHDRDFLTVKDHYLGFKNDYPQRHHVRFRAADGTTPSRSLWFGISATGGETPIKHDQHMHNALLNNVGSNMLNAFMLYRIDLPSWLDAGWGHLQCRNNSEVYNFFTLGEGQASVAKDVSNWAPVVRKLVQKDRAISFAELGRATQFSHLDFDAHLVSWSKVQFLSLHNAESFSNYVLALKLDPSQSGNLSVQRKSMKSAYGWTLIQAEEAWKAWVLATYPVK